MATEYVERREGNYFLVGSRVSLDSVVHGFLEGESPETIRDNFPSLSLEQIYGAIASYLGNQAEVDGYLKRKAADYESARLAQTHISSDLRERMKRFGQPR